MSGKPTSLTGEVLEISYRDDPYDGPWARFRLHPERGLPVVCAAFGAEAAPFIRGSLRDGMRIMVNGLSRERSYSLKTGEVCKYRQLEVLWVDAADRVGNPTARH